MISNNTKQECAIDISNSVRRSAKWRRELQAKYPDPRNGRAAETLSRLACEFHNMTDGEFAQLAEHYNWASSKWSEAVSETSRRVGYRGVDSVSAFLNHLVGILSRSDVAA